MGYLYVLNQGLNELIALQRRSSFHERSVVLREWINREANKLIEEMILLGW